MPAALRRGIGARDERALRRAFSDDQRRRRGARRARRAGAGSDGNSRAIHSMQRNRLGERRAAPLRDAQRAAAPSSLREDDAQVRGRGKPRPRRSSGRARPSPCPPRPPSAGGASTRNRRSSPGARARRAPRRRRPSAAPARRPTARPRACAGRTTRQRSSGMPACAMRGRIGQMRRIDPRDEPFILRWRARAHRARSLTSPMPTPSCSTSESVPVGQPPPGSSRSSAAYARWAA